MEEEARSTSQAQEKKDEGSFVSDATANIALCMELTSFAANKLLAPRSQLPIASILIQNDG